MSKIRKNAKYLLFIVIFSASFLWCLSEAANDLLWQIIEPAYEWDTIIKIWENVDTVWKTVIEWSTEVGKWIKNWPSIIVKVTRILLSFVIALSITMILYNGMQYIIQTWQWKDSKDLTKNIAYIVVWILIALFSVVIITLIQSVPKTIETELDGGQRQDNEIVEGKGKSFKEFFKGFSGG